MTGLVLLILAFVVLTALAVWLDHAGINVGDFYGTDPRELVDRARERGER